MRHLAGFGHVLALDATVLRLHDPLARSYARANTRRQVP